MTEWNTKVIEVSYTTYHLHRALAGFNPGPRCYDHLWLSGLNQVGPKTKIEFGNVQIVCSSDAGVIAQRILPGEET